MPKDFKGYTEPGVGKSKPSSGASSFTGMTEKGCEPPTSKVPGGGTKRTENGGHSNAMGHGSNKKKGY